MTNSNPLRSSWWHAYSQQRFGILLVILLALLGGSPILVELGMSGQWYDGLMSLLMVAAILPLCFEPLQRLLALLLGVPTIIFSLGGYAFTGSVGIWVLFIGHLCEAMFFAGAAVLIVRSLFNNRKLTVDSIFGAACGYLFLGLGWAVLYSLIEEFRPGSFAANPSLVVSDPDPRVLPHVLTYYSFVTLTTVGYGDVTPISATTRTFAWIEAMSGQFYLAVIVAGLVSMISANPSQSAPRIRFLAAAMPVPRKSDFVLGGLRRFEGTFGPVPSSNEASRRVKSTD